MCLIADANKLPKLLVDRDHEAQPIRDWLAERRGGLVYSDGGKWADELGALPNAARVLRTMREAGQARLVPHASFREDERRLSESGRLKSDDPHVIALARKSGARLLYTDDSSLIKDFKDKALIDQPRGKVYSHPEHTHLFRNVTCRPA